MPIAPFSTEAQEALAKRFPPGTEIKLVCWYHHCANQPPIPAVLGQPRYIHPFLDGFERLYWGHFLQEEEGAVIGYELKQNIVCPGCKRNGNDGLKNIAIIASDGTTENTFMVMHNNFGGD